MMIFGWKAGARVCAALLLSMATLPVARGQIVGDVLEIDEKTFGFHGDLAGKMRTFQADREALDIVKNVMASIGLPLRFEVYAAPVPNAAAVVHEGKRYILYNVIFMEKVKSKSGDYWSLMSIMAHEIGHHLSFHLTDAIEDHKAELEADYFSGFVLGKLGATLQQSLATMESLAPTVASTTHPGRDDRLQAIAVGWKAAVGNKRPDPAQVENAPSIDPPQTSGTTSNSRNQQSAVCGWYAIHYCSRDPDEADRQSAKFGGYTIDTSDPAFPNFSDGWYCSVLGPLEKSSASATTAAAKRRGFPSAYIKNSC